MRPISPVLRSQLYSITYGAIALFLVCSLVLYPEQAFQSSLKGLRIWWDVVFPALLPFFIASEILMGFGVVHFLGVLLEPLMRPLFRVPGVGAFVMAMGLASGYPIGAKLTARLREEGLISRTEGERLVSFTNTADPLFMFGAVAVGFFHDVSLGITLALAHYLASILLGIIMRFHEPHGPSTPPPPADSSFFLLRGLRAMHRARLADGRGLGQLMGDAISTSIKTLLVIGGFIMMFSVVIEVLGKIGVTNLLGVAISPLLATIGIPIELSSSVIAGMFEITLGSQVASQAPAHVDITYKMAIVSAVIAWSGFSVHAQVANILSKTDIRYGPYCFARLIHGVLAGSITLIAWNPIQQYLVSSKSSLPVFVREIPSSEWVHWSNRIHLFGWQLLFILGLLLLTIILWKQVKSWYSKGAL
ncbi:sporulation integral membrane protein YlbJ [Marininema halotolerans]|uniref:Sporulation integral membrane protein YlbJ n=1 Tax=Marininema halotolerans TaxID=1155944 RepID=A0A1I6QG30_9BACL|nr:sporulation integral membrane protein YlbJ [Marininema halotolerans]SFS51449.1 sporulation integral membrane protein YlbJ [Marininema halotolerans]